MTTSNITQFITVIFLAVLVSACVSAPPTPTLATGESMTIRRPVVEGLDAAVDSKATRVGKGVALGAAGAVGGAALGSSMGGMLGFACGPAAIICVPIGLAAGAGIGGVGGGVMGASYGGRGGISGDKADRFNAIAARVMDESSLESKLHDQFSASAGQYWVLRDDSANSVLLKVNSLRFKQLGEEQIQLAVNAELRVAFGERSQVIKVEQLGARRHIDYWLNDDGENFRAEIEHALQRVSRTLVDRVSGGSGGPAVGPTVGKSQIAQR